MESKTDRTRLADILIAVVVLGSLWGFTEVVLDSAIRAAGLPFRAGILTGIGIGLLAIAMGAFRRPALLVLIPPVAILCKQLVVPILSASVMCKANSCLAVMLEGLAVIGVVYLIGRRLDRNRVIQAASGASGALLGAGAFYFAGMRLAPCQYLLSFNSPVGFVRFMLVEGVVWAAFSAVLFPVGYRVGAQLRDTILAQERKPWFYYAASATIVAGSWAASAVAISAGL
jgi:hypothetical protein